MELWTLHWRKKWIFGTLAIYIGRDLSRLLVSHKLTHFLDLLLPPPSAGLRGVTAKSEKGPPYTDGRDARYLAQMFSYLHVFIT